jgi:hypothetical protein
VIPEAVGKAMLVVCVLITRIKEPREIGVPLAITRGAPGVKVIPAKTTLLAATVVVCPLTMM